MKCPICHVRNRADAEYCVACQHPLSDIKVPVRKKCPKCGIIYGPDRTHCEKCQNQLIDLPKNGIGKWIAILTASVAVIAIVVVLVISSFFRLGFNRAIENRDAEQLVSLCTQKPSLLDDEKRRNQYRDLINDRYEDFLNDRISYEQVVHDYDIFDAINLYRIDEEIETDTALNRRKIEIIHESSIVFEEAEQAFQDEDYASSEELYTSIPETGGKYYSSAQDRLAEIDSMKAAYLERAANQFEKNEISGVLEMLSEGAEVFSYDESYNQQIRETMEKYALQRTNELMEQGVYFSTNGTEGAYNVVNSFLSYERFAKNENLINLRYTVVEQSENSQLAQVAEMFGLNTQNNVVDRCADTAAEAYSHDPIIQQDGTYILTLCQNDDGIQGLLAETSDDVQIHAALVTNFAVTAEDFYACSQEYMEVYADYNWVYSGVGRYYDKEANTFSWAVILLYEME